MSTHSTPAEEITVYLGNPQQQPLINQSPLHLRAFLNNLNDPLIRARFLQHAVLVCMLRALTLFYEQKEHYFLNITTAITYIYLMYLGDIFTIILLLFELAPLPKDTPTLFLTRLGPILLTFLLLYLYEIITLPTDHSITLSLSTQTMHAKRVGCLLRGITLPLNQLIGFVSRNMDGYTHTNKRPNQNYIIAQTTGGPIKLGSSNASYDATVSQLNQFLQHHRTTGKAKAPCTPLRSGTVLSAENIFQLLLVQLAQVQLPKMSQLSFRAQQGRVFNFHKQVPGGDIPNQIGVAFGLAILWLARNGILYHKLPVHQLMNFVWTCHIVGKVLYDDSMRKHCWLFSDRSTHYSHIPRAFHVLFGTEHIPVKMYSRMELSVRHEKDTVEKVRFLEDTCEQTLKYTVYFVSENGKSQEISALSEGDAVFLTTLLRTRFPHMFRIRVRSQTPTN